MNLDTQKKVSKPLPKKAIIVALSVFVLIILALSVQAFFSISNAKINKGVYIDNFDVSGLSKDELRKILKKDFQDNTKDVNITIKSKDITENVSLADLDVTYNVEKIVDKAYSIGRKGNIFQRLYEIYVQKDDTKKIELDVEYDTKKVEDLIQKIYDKTLVTVKEADMFIRETKIVIRSGHHGENIDKNKATETLITALKSNKSSTIEIPVIKVLPKKIDVENYYKQICINVKDAQAKVENNKVTVLPHVIGRTVDKDQLKQAALELDQKENIEKELTATLIQPKITTQDVNSKLFIDTLYTFHTQFTTRTQNNANRGINIRLAVSKINGKVLAPSETFSFNQIVGPRTEAKGYKTAHTYLNGTIDNGVGGGICQVSSTLYNAVLLADLDIVERRNHSLLVTYVPKGRDAAVSYSSPDLKFRNSTKWPLRIEAWVTASNQVYFSLRGTNETPGKTVDITTKQVSTTPPSVKYINDPTLEEGKMVTKSSGMTGYVIDTFKTVKVDGKVVSEKKIGRSIYKALAKQVRKGTKKVGPTSATPNLVQQTPKPQVKPSTGVVGATPSTKPVQ